MGTANSTLYDQFDVARFWSKVDVKSKNQCWEWLAGRRPSGHGDFQARSGATYAHRFAYMIVNGAAADGLVVRHKCDNPACCNPLHLETGTHSDNVSDRVDRGRSAKGSSNGRAKITLEQAIAIRLSPSSPLELSKIYPITARAIQLIKDGKNWKSSIGCQIIPIP